MADRIPADVPEVPPPAEYARWQRAAVEAIGTFFLVFVGAGTAAMTLILAHGAPTYNPDDIGIGALGGAGDWLAIGLAFAFAIMTMVYIFGHVSGQHINPAVTLALLVRGEISVPDACVYWVAQFIGGTAGAYAIGLVYGHAAWATGGLGAAAPFPGVPLWRAGIAEGIGTFLLVLGVYGMAVNKKAPAGWAGFIIALNIGGVIIMLGNVSGQAINPARAFGPVFADWTLGVATRWDALGVYILAELIGAVLGAWLYPVVAIRAAGLVRPAARKATETAAMK
ncbi:MAG TPA: MIP/aquaporin family protein [Trebonia sp.]|nr:MIP/aquaporin family protein [Trebonia sp.]